MAMLRFVQTVYASSLLHRLHTVALVQLSIYTYSFLGTRTLSVGYPSFATMGRSASPQIGSTPQAVELDSDTMTESEAHKEKPAPMKEKGDLGKSVQPKKKISAKANLPRK